MDVRLKTLLSVAQTKNFTRSANELALTQPAVSHHIKQLETEYGIRIFEKNGKNIRLTDAGMRLVEYAEKSRSIENTFLSDIRVMAEKPCHFSIGVTITLAENILSGIMAVYCQKHPDLTLDIYCDSRKTLIKKLIDCELDWVLINYPAPEGFNVYPLCKDKSRVIVSPDHPLANEKKITFEQFKKEKMILCYKNNYAMQVLDEELQKGSLRADDLNVVVETNSLKVIKKLVEGNVGISILQVAACQAEINEGKLVALPLEGVNMDRSIHFICRPGFAYPDLFQELKNIYEDINFCNTNCNKIELDAGAGKS
ncbi:MAG: LysR family transcriptional regulator [Clostridia bacterium]|nr:LysR family transcriptional regulator [Clostridia bacterium]